MPSIKDARPFLRHIADLNHHERGEFVPWYIDERAVGLIRRSFIRYLSVHPRIFDIYEDRIDLIAAPAERIDRLAGVIEELSAAGPVRLPRRAVSDRRALGRRAAGRSRSRRLSVFSASGPLGCHINGYVRQRGAYRMWIGKRAKGPDRIARKAGPSGGRRAACRADGGGDDTKEAHEEAGILPSVASKAVPCGFVSYIQDAASASSATPCSSTIWNCPKTSRRATRMARSRNFNSCRLKTWPRSLPTATPSSRIAILSSSTFSYATGSLDRMLPGTRLWHSGCGVVSISSETGLGRFVIERRLCGEDPRMLQERCFAAPLLRMTRRTGYVAEYPSGFRPSLS